MRSVIAAVLVPVVVIFLVGPYTFLPSLIEYAVATDVQNRLGIEKQPEVKLKSDPSLYMLRGEFSDGRIAKAWGLEDTYKRLRQLQVLETSREP